jgi:hypothetical protein
LWGLATALATVLVAWEFARLGTSESILMAVVCAGYPVAVWIGAARVRATDHSGAHLAIQIAFFTVLGFFALGVLSGAQLERAQEACEQ